MSLKIHLADEARRWLAGKDAALTLRGSLKHGCCGGSARGPVAEASTPRETEKYERRTVDGIAVYLERPVPEDGELTVRVESLFGFRRLFVEGAS